jgi:hypothetical protein
MAADPFLRWFLAGDPSVWISALALIVALTALLLTSGAKRRAVEEADSLRLQIGTLGRELEEFRVDQFNSADRASTTTNMSETGIARYSAEKEAYDVLWPQVWQLHDRLGMFLRAVQSGEDISGLRQDTRNAALDSRALLSRYRPFCCASVEELLTYLIDTEIKAHMAACQYLDLLKDAANTPSDHDRRVQQDKCHVLYEIEAKDLLNRLITAIRQRVLGSQ